MEFAKTPMIKVYSRGSSLAGSNQRARILAQLNGSDEEEEDLGRTNPVASRIEGDLNWASKYLHSDRAPSLPRGQSRGSCVSSSTKDLKAQSQAPGRANDHHLEESMTFRGQSRRSISPMKFREDRQEINGSFLRSSRASASPLSTRKDFGSRNGHLVMNSGRPPICSASPIISHPVTRTYNDLDRKLVTPGNPNVLADSRHIHREPLLVRGPQSEKHCSGDQRTKKPISGTRKKLRSILCRSRNDPHYFDED